MNAWESTAEGVRLRDAVGNELTLGLTDWQRVAPDVEARASTADLAVETTGLTVPRATLSVSNLATGETVTVDATTGPRSLPPSEYMAVVPGTPSIAIRFTDASTVAPAPDGDSITVEFDDAAVVHVERQRAVRAPTEVVTVPRTIEGVATAITHLSAAHRTTTPDRTLWPFRGHPPAIAFGDDYDVPDAVRERTPETGIDIVVPGSLADTFVVAPLAYSLGASVTLEPDADPRLRAPAAGVDRHLGPDLTETVPPLLARTFWFDCLARNGGPHAEPALAEHDLLSQVGIDHASAYGAPPAERLAMYLDAPYERVADDLPEWPLAMHVAPRIDHVGALPALLDHLAVIYPPETEPLEGPELVERTLDDFYRGPPGPITSVEMLKPRLRDGHVNGWLADGAPIDVFKTLPEAYDNAPSRTAFDDEMSVVVVLNDRDMTGEHDRVAEIYADRANTHGIDVSLHEDLTRAELADVFQEPHAFLHYIGHCEVEGLRCADGNLALANLPETGVQTFFLNACGSYYEGLDLVRRGAIAGAVTFRKVLDEPAAKVGTAFARLLLSGFPIEVALRLARRRIMMGKDYAVVGNGMQTLPTGRVPETSVAYVETRADGDLAVSWDVVPTGDHGGTYRVAVAPDTPPRLRGNRTEFTMAPGVLAEFVADRDLPVILDGEFHWSHELAETLEG